MTVTIKDVARQAGVSISTVSKVINNWSTISEATKSRIHTVMRDLDYMPNTRAASFARRSTREIGFLAPLDKRQAFCNPHMFEIMCGAAQMLAKNGYTLCLVDVSSYPSAMEATRSAITSRSFDGIIIHGSIISTEIAQFVVQKNFPHILIGCPDFDTNLCWIDTNNVLSGDIATRHLVDNGHNIIVFVAGEHTGKLSRARVKGFLTVMNEFNLDVPEWCIQYTGSNAERGYDIMMDILHNSTRPEAVICESNQIAIWVLKALKKHNIDVPGEISLISFDEYPISHLMDPIPTVVDIDVFDLGMQVGSALMRKIKNPTIHIQSYTTLPTLIQHSTIRNKNRC